MVESFLGSQDLRNVVSSSSVVEDSLEERKTIGNEVSFSFLGCELPILRCSPDIKGKWKAILTLLTRGK